MAPGPPIARRQSARCHRGYACARLWLSPDTLAMLALAGLATVVTETLAGASTIKIERMRITDAGRRAIEG